MVKLGLFRKTTFWQLVWKNGLFAFKHLVTLLRDLEEHFSEPIYSSLSWTFIIGLWRPLCVWYSFNKDHKSDPFELKITLGMKVLNVMIGWKCKQPIRKLQIGEHNSTLNFFSLGTTSEDLLEPVNKTKVIFTF